MPWGTLGEQGGHMRTIITTTARETWDLNCHPTSALGCKILASCDGFLGLSWTGSGVLNHGASWMGCVGLWTH